MCIDNFDTWFEIAKLRYDKYSFKDILKECWDNAYQAGKDDRYDEFRSQEVYIKDLEIDNGYLQEKCERLETELEDLEIESRREE